MGVRGLSSYLLQNPDNFEPFRLHNTPVIIDASNFINYIYFDRDLYTQFGGEYLKLDECLTKIINNMRRCALTPVFMFDGCSDEFKLDTQLFRSKQRLQTCRDLIKRARTQPDPTHTSLCVKILPSLAVVSVAQTLERLQVDYVVATGEADMDAVALSIHLNCPVISNDSDFYITIPVTENDFPCLVPLTSLSLTPHVYPDDHQCNRTVPSECMYLECYKFLPNGPGLRKLPSSQRPVFAILSGNDFVPSAFFSKSLPLSDGLRIPLAKSATREMRFNRRRSFYRRIIDWLSGFGDNVEESLGRIISRLPQVERRRGEQLLKISLAHYRVDQELVVSQLVPFLSLKLVDTVDDFDLEPSSSHPFKDSAPLSSSQSNVESEDELETEDPKSECSHSCPENPIPVPSKPDSPITSEWSPFLLRAFRRSHVFPMYLNPFLSKALVLPCAVEVLNHNKSIYACAKPVRQLAYNLLLPLLNTKHATVVTEYSRHGNGSMKASNLSVNPLIADFSIIDQYLTTGVVQWPDFPWITGLCLLTAIWHGQVIGGEADQCTTCAPILSLAAIVICSHLLIPDQLHLSLKTIRRVLHQLDRCASQLSESNGIRYLKLEIVHSLGQMQAVYSALFTVLTLLNRKSSDEFPIRLPSIFCTFPSGHCFHSVVSFLSPQSPKERFQSVREQILPRLLLSTDLEEKARTMLNIFLSRLSSIRRGLIISLSKINVTCVHTLQISKSPTDLVTAKKNKTRTRRHFKTKKVRPFDEIEAEVTRLMQEHGLVD